MTIITKNFDFNHYLGFDADLYRPVFKTVWSSLAMHEEVIRLCETISVRWLSVSVSCCWHCRVEASLAADMHVCRSFTRFYSYHDVTGSPPLWIEISTKRCGYTTVDLYVLSLWPIITNHWACTEWWYFHYLPEETSRLKTSNKLLIK